MLAEPKKRERKHKISLYLWFLFYISNVFLIVSSPIVYKTYIVSIFFCTFCWLCFALPVLSYPDLPSIVINIKQKCTLWSKHAKRKRTWTFLSKIQIKTYWHCSLLLNLIISYFLWARAFWPSLSRFFCCLLAWLSTWLLFQESMVLAQYGKLSPW